MKKPYVFFLFLLTMLFAGSSTAQSISYRSSFNFSAGVTFTTSESVLTEETQPTDVIFSQDGLKVFILGLEDEINQYTVATPFDISTGISHDGTYNVGTEEGNPFSIKFNHDGSKFYILGTATDRVYQYSLSVPYDITSTVTLDGNYFVGLGNPNSFSFNNDGTRFYVGTTSGHQIHQYNLTNPYDVTSGVITTAGSSDPFPYSVYDFLLTNNGAEVFILNTTDGINHFALTTPYDISSGLTEIGEVLSVSLQESSARGFTFNPSGNRFFLIGFFGRDINQFELNTPTYSEAIFNDGSFTDTFNSFGLVDETFSNPGGTLVYNTDYQISNLPAGLTPLVQISSSGQYGSISLTGNATNHQNINDVASLIFTFNNSAFAGGDASAVVNAVGASTGISLDFRNNSTPIVSYGRLPNLIGTTANTSTFSIAAQDGSPEDMAFNPSGSKVFVLGSISNTIYEYNLTTPFDITSGVSYSGNSHSVGTEESIANGLEFSLDGLTMFISGRGHDEINQYSLSSAYDLSSTISHQGVLDISSQTTNPHGLAFSPDGRTLLACGDDIYQYNLTTPFDITSGVSYETFFNQTSIVTEIEFGPDGTQLLYLNSNRAFGIYDLSVPYSIAGDVTGGSSFSVLAQDGSPRGIGYSPDRRKLFMVGISNDNIHQYPISPNKFEESFDDNGTVMGSVSLRVVDDQFNNAGSTLTQNVDYTVVGLPAGLSPLLTVSANGLTADLTLAGTASNHSIGDAVSNLNFTFNNSAFVNSNAASVINAVGSDTHFSIDYKDLEGVIFGTDSYVLTGLTFDNNPISVATETLAPRDILFNNDGTKMLVPGSNEGVIIQYSLTTPYDVSSGISVDGTPLDVSAEETIPSGISFNNDGTKFYLIGLGRDRLHQYSLGTPYDLNGTVTHEGEMPFTNGIGVTFSSDGSRMFLTSGAVISQFVLNVPYDITAGTGLVATSGTTGSNAYSPSFSPNGRELFILSGSHRNIYRFPLSNAFDISDGLTHTELVNVSSQDTSPGGMAISPNGKTFYISGLVGDDINVFHLPGIGFTEVSANSGALDGTYIFSLVGDAFVNASGTLAEGSHFNITGLPPGLSGSMSVSGDGSSATLSLAGNAADHQNADDITTDIQVAFLNAAFVSGDASSVGNSTTSINSDFDFTDNGTLTYVPEIFRETYVNEGEIDGSMTIQISGETFSSPGLLTSGVDYSIANVPSGLTPQLFVAANRLSAALTFLGSSENHQDVNDLSDLVFTFENAAFTTSDAAFVFNATGASSGSSINFYDNEPLITYGSRFDLTDETPTLAASFSVVNEDDGPGGMAFSNDGMKMFMVGFTNDRVFEYDLSTAFDVSSGASYSGNSLDISTETSSPGDIHFSTSGSTMYIMDGSGDEVEQYGLATPYDLATVTHAGSFDVGSQDIQPAAITFSSDGERMYMIGSFNNQVHQYSLSVPFDVTSPVSYDGTPFTVIDRNYTGISISKNGKRLFVANGPFPGAAYIRQYDFSTPFDITDGLAEVGSFYLDTQGPSDFEVSPDGKKLFILRASDDAVLQYDLPFDGFDEVTKNNGEVTGSLHLEIRDERFTNADGTMTYGSDYSLTNLPSGLVATLDVDTDGFSATLSLSGNAADHQDINDVELQFTFNNSAFEGGNAGNVMNSSGVGSTRFIDFNDNNPVVLYGDPLSMANAAYSGTSFDLSVQDGYPTGLAFNADGTTMFITGGDNSFVYEYSLSTGFDLTSTIAYTGTSLDVSVESDTPEDMYLSTNGTRLYILSYNGIVAQYNLPTAFDLTSAVYSGNTYDPTVQGDDVYSLTFSSDGSKMYVVSTSTEAINQYSLSTPFDLSTISYDGNPLDVSNEEYSPTGIVFSQNGHYLLVVGDGEYAAARYILNTPFDVTQGTTFDGLLFDLSAQNDGPSGVGSSPDGSRLFVLDGSNSDIEQYNIDAGGFIETIANNGTLEGSATIYMIDDTFTNAGGTLNLGSDYGINNLPAGFTPTLSVAADGYSATLTVTGSSASHGNADDIASLQFNFSNSAFTDYNANEVGNAINHSSILGIDYRPSAENDITSFTFSEIEAPATLNTGTHTVDAEAVAGTDISAITPTISISTASAISPNTGVEQDFTSTVIYTVTAEDGTPQSWNVTITEALATPTDITMSDPSIDENQSSNSAVGTFSSADASFNDSHVYALIAGAGDNDNGSFTIVGDELRSAGVFDFETKDTYFIRVETNDGNGGLFEKAFTISINDVNEIPTDIDLTDMDIDESNPIGTSIGTLSTTDEDLGQSYTYTLVAGAGDADNASFATSGDQLQSAEVFDFETKTTYFIRIETNDGNGGTYAEAFTISINDLPASVTSLDLTSQTVNENEASGTVVGDFLTSGEDLSGSFTYTFATGAGDTDNSSFSISGDQLLTAASFDFETKNSYFIRVMTDDGIGNTLEEMITVSVTDVSEVPTDIMLSATSLTENNGINDVVGMLSTTDVDAGETYSYTLVSGSGDTDNASFNISGSNLQAGEIFDFETKSSYSIRLQTNDGNGGTYQEAFTISIVDENESIVVASPIADQLLNEGFASFEIDLGPVFSDEDGDPLTYSASSSDENVVTVATAGSTLTITEAGFGPATITVTANDGSGVTTSDEFIVTVSEVFSTETDITAFSLAQQTGAATIDATAHTVSIEVASGTNVTGLTPTIEVSAGASVSPTGAQSFANGTITYTVTAEDGVTTQNWIATVTVEESALGLDDEIQINVYPNPVTDFINVASDQSLSIKVVDIKGQKVLNQKSGQNVSIDVRRFSPGAYLLMIRGEGVNTTRRFIKIN
ncbi:MAG: T9SS type A sorting domain-containing protein [Cyclobacteriaceae bacterium]